MLAVIERTSGSRSFWLLLSLFALILAIPIAEKTGIGEGSIKVAFALVILSGIYRAGRRRGGFLIAVTIALLWLALATSRSGLPTSSRRTTCSPRCRS